LAPGIVDGLVIRTGLARLDGREVSARVMAGIEVKSLSKVLCVIMAMRWRGCLGFLGANRSKFNSVLGPKYAAQYNYLKRQNKICI
jgi:hypothetical protein